MGRPNVTQRSRYPLQGTPGRLFSIFAWRKLGREEILRRAGSRLGARVVRLTPLVGGAGVSRGSLVCVQLRPSVFGLTQGHLTCSQNAMPIDHRPHIAAS